MTASPDQIDFFVSYNHADEEWAEWVAWVLEEADYTTRIQAWDFRPGSNFVLEMDEAARMADRTIAILSPNYLGSHFAAPEWAAAFAEDPEGRHRSVVPVRIAPSRADGMLAQLVWIDLVGLSREEAKTALLAGLRPGRAKPVTEPAFPGPVASSPAGAGVAPGSGPPPAARIIWTPLSDELQVTWRADLVGNSSQSMTATVELHLVPVTPLHLEVRRIASLGDELADLGRRAGMFGAGQAIDIQSDATRAYARGAASRAADEAGLAVTRSAQRSAWIVLPHDGMGAVFDPDDLRPRLVSLLAALQSIDIPSPPQTAFALRIEPLTMVSVANASTIGHRSTAQMPFVSRQRADIRPVDAVATRLIVAGGTGIADELVARLNAELSQR